jgi:hypothetical protein
VTQVHLAALSLVPVVGLAVVVVLLQRLRRRSAASLWLPLAVGIAAAALLYLPYLAADAQAGWRNVRALTQPTSAPAQTQWQAVRYALLNVGGREIHALAGPERYREFLDGVLELDYWPDRIEEAAVVLGALYLGVQCVRQRNEPHALARNGLLLGWLLLPPLVFLRSGTPVYPHYLIPVYPAPYLVLAIAATQLFAHVRKAYPRERVRHWMATLAALPPLLLATWQSYLSFSIYAFVDQHDTPGGMGTPIRVTRDVTRTLRDRTAAWGSQSAVLLCPGDDPRWDECPAVYGFVTSRSLDLRIADGRANLLLPYSETDTPLVVAPGAEAAFDLLPAFVQPLPALDVPLREDVAHYRFYRLPGGSQAGVPEQAPVRMANGVELLGYRFARPPRPGQTTRLVLHWRVRALPPDPPPQGYSFANHLLVAGGEPAVRGQARVAQADGPGHPVALWREGDVVLSAFDLVLAADAAPPPYRLRIGMYVHTPPDQFVTIPVVDEQGSPIADAVEWPVP